MTEKFLSPPNKYYPQNVRKPGMNVWTNEHFSGKCGKDTVFSTIGDVFPILPVKHNFMTNGKILLASQSPRRRELLKQAGFDFRALVADVDESYNGQLPPDKFPEHLAVEKANAVKDKMNKGEVILAADTIVLKDGIIYGKPVDRADAVRILKQLSGACHEVITGVCLLSGARSKTFSSLTKVHFTPLTDEQIAYYIDNFHPYDKAGGYAIQEWIGLIGISKIEGCYFNVMGLPVSRVYEELISFS